MSVSGILKKLYPMDREKRYPMDLSKRRKVILSAKTYAVAGIKSDGTCVAVSDTYAIHAWQKTDVDKWTDIVAIATGNMHTVGLKSDGTCVAVGENYTCSVYNEDRWNRYYSLSRFKNVVAIANNSNDSTMLLMSNGKCALNGIATAGQPEHDYGDLCKDVEGWTDIVSIAFTGDCAVGIKSDGSCRVSFSNEYSSQRFNVPSTWTDLIEVAVVSHAAALALKSDGTCILTRNYNYTQKSEVMEWKDVVTIATAGGGFMGLKADGTCVVYAVDSNVKEAVSKWKDIIAIAGGFGFCVGLKSDGTCMLSYVAKNYFPVYLVAGWHLMQYFRQGLLTSKTPINLLDKTSVSGFTVKGIEPVNTKRRIAFKVEDKWNKLSTAGALTPLATQEITADSVLEEGNTVADLEAITTTTGLAGKLIYPAVALYADPEAEVMPTFGMTVKAEIDTTVNVYSYTGYSQEYSLSAGEDVQVVNVAAETESTGEGNVVVTARLKQGGEWTDYMALSDTAMKQASALQLKAVYTVTNTDGSQSAKVKNVTIRYTTSGATVNGVSTDIVTKTQRFTNDLVYAHCYVKHKKLQDAVIDAYCSLRKRPKSKSMYQFGNGTGALNTYKLPDAGINQDTLSVYVDGKAVYDFGYNTETSEITLTADKDTALSASYECGWERSEWIKMVQGVSQVNDGGGYTTEYSYTVPTHEGYEYTVTAIKYSLVRPEGTVTKETIGVGTGKRQMVELPHFAKKETIVCNGAWSYDYDRKLLTIIAPEGEDIVISYDWIAETPTVYAISAGWAD